MAAVPDPMKSLGFTGQFLAARRARFLPAADRSALQTIRCGVLFIMAFWSGPARVAFAYLKEVLADADPDGRLELVVVDTDDCPELYDLPEFQGRLASGAGETAWISEGQIVSVSAFPNVEAFRRNTIDLLRMCGA